ncbi:trypsin-like serine peptidase [Ramlibacter henchirensis]|uniref:trypsin-like serine peptidase n=1 Tax=Ramlibacter henchirensis TaxID=204072 RepID=UPI001F110DFD|nr:serine protease [Ramlibacter henchirensis]
MNAPPPASPQQPPHGLDPTLIEPVLLTATQVSTFAGQVLLTRASGFFFKRDGRLYVVTSRHVLSDEPTGHSPDRVEVAVHTDARDLSKWAVLSCDLFRDRQAVWHQGRDAAGAIDVAALEIDESALPPSPHLRWFTPEHLLQTFHSAQIGAPLVLLGYPLGFHDTVHHLPVARHAIIASAFGVRFQRQGYFLTDARAHRGSSGSPVLMKIADDPSDMPWKLLGVHSSRMDMGGRDSEQDDFLGLNCAWYADILMTLTEERSPHAGPLAGQA